jgi:hypothetical protein
MLFGVLPFLFVESEDSFAFEVIDSAFVVHRSIFARSRLETVVWLDVLALKFLIVDGMGPAGSQFSEVPFAIHSSASLLLPTSFVWRI